MTTPTLCKWCHSQVRMVCEHPACVGAYIQSYCTVFCQATDKLYPSRMELSA